MSDANGRAIKYLLAAILFVMLFGASAFLTGLAWIAGIGAVFAVILIVSAAAISIFRTSIHEIVSAKAKQKPWVWLAFAMAGIAGNAIVFLLAGVQSVMGGSPFRDAVEAVPYGYGPVVLMLVGALVYVVESFRNWGPKVPGFIASLFHGWLYWIGSPVLAPIGLWHKIKADRAAGGRTGVIAAGFSLIWEFVISLFFCCLAVTIPTLLILKTVKSLLEI